MCLKCSTFPGIYVVLDKLSSKDWSPLSRLDPRYDDSMHGYVGWVGKVLYIIFSWFSPILPKCYIFGMLKHVHCNVGKLTVIFWEID